MGCANGLTGFKGGGCGCCCDKCDHIKARCHDCCFCVCRSICVTLDNEPGGSASQCGCDDATQKTDWDCDTNSYSNTITCGSVSVDYKISFRKLDDGKCYICLDSSCFRSESAESVSTQEQCILLGDPSEVKCTGLDGGAGWTFDLAECVSDQSCADMSVTLTIECIDYINPVEFGCDAECENCECVCKCLCIDYSGGLCTQDIALNATERVCWDKDAKHWQITFPCDTSAGDAQTLTITFDPDSAGECSLLLTATLGEVVDPRQGVSCPDISAAWTIRFEDASEAIVTVLCSWCDECLAFACCGIPSINQPETLTVTLEVEGEGQCSCLDGMTFVANKVSNGNVWVVSDTQSVCDEQQDPNGMEFVCGPDCEDWSMPRFFITQCTGEPPPTAGVNIGCSCDPLDILFEVKVSGMACCEGFTEGTFINVRLTL